MTVREGSSICPWPTLALTTELGRWPDARPPQQLRSDDYESTGRQILAALLSSPPEYTDVHKSNQLKD